METCQISPRSAYTNSANGLWIIWDKGISAIEAELAHQPEAIISVRGKDRFVVMNIAHYHYLRECEPDAALAETQADLAAGRFVKESAEAHLARLDAAE